MIMNQVNKTMKKLLKGLNEASKRIHEDAVLKGFYDEPREVGTLLMLVVSELSEALEADRKSKFAEPVDRFVWFDDWELKDKSFDRLNFQEYFKDSHEDEIADTIIRLLDYAGYKGIDLEWHIEQKLKYNKTRPLKHGKSY